ncbi:MAG: hypothetical protein QM628_17390 [Propionicimonas sp.]
MTNLSHHDPENERPMGPSSADTPQPQPGRDLDAGLADPRPGEESPSDGPYGGRPPETKPGDALPDLEPASGTGTGSSSVKDAALAGADDVKEAALAGAGEVRDIAMERGGDVAHAAREELSQLTEEARSQALSLWSQASEQLREQAVNGKQQAADLLHSLADELGQMASRSEQDGPLTALAKEAAARAGELSHWLQNAEPSDVVAEIRRFARRRPVVFLAGAALAGVVVGRLSRGMMAAADEHRPKGVAPSGGRVSASAAGGGQALSGGPVRATQDFDDDTDQPQAHPLADPTLGSVPRRVGDGAAGGAR